MSRKKCTLQCVDCKKRYECREDVDWKKVEKQRYLAEKLEDDALFDEKISRMLWEWSHST